VGVEVSKIRKRKGGGEKLRKEFSDDSPNPRRPKKQKEKKLSPFLEKEGNSEEGKNKRQLRRKKKNVSFTGKREGRTRNTFTKKIGRGAIMKEEKGKEGSAKLFKSSKEKDWGKGRIVRTRTSRFKERKNGGQKKINKVCKKERGRD